MKNYQKIFESYYHKSKSNNSVEHMEDVFMTPEDEFDTETGKFEYNIIPMKTSYSKMMSYYNDFCSNYIDAFDTEDEHYTFIYDKKIIFGDEYSNIITQDGDKGRMIIDGKIAKRIEKKLPKEERFQPVPRNGLVAIIHNNADEELYWYKNNIGKMLLQEYTGWSFEELGDIWR